MANAIGWSKSKTHGALHTLARDGLVKLATDKDGTVVRIPAAA
jgi:uncharacterized membrane protein